jgi:hypothetical protein
MRKKRLNKTSLFMAMFMVISMIFPNFSNNNVEAAIGPTDLIISEYVEGNSNNKAIELYNGTGKNINLGSYSLETYFNGNSTFTKLTLPSYELVNGSTYVIVNSSSVTGLTNKANLSTTNGALTFNGDDAIVLKKGTVVVDSIGSVGSKTIWGANQTLVRKNNITIGDTNTTNTFDQTIEWDGFPVDTFTNLGSHSMVVAPTNADPVTSNITGGAVPAGTAVTLSTTTIDAKIYYTTNGNNPTTESTVYSTPIILNQDTTIKAFAKSDSTDPSDITTFIYSIIDTTAPSAPFVNPVTNADEIITGTAEANTSVFAKVNDQEIGTSLVDTDGKFIIPISRQNVGTIILITATDSAGNISSPTEVTVSRANLKVNSVLLSVDKQSPQIIGTPLNIIATSEGSLEPDYQFYIRENGNLSILQEYGNGDTVTWTPTRTGKYKIIVYAKDKMTPGNSYEAKMEMTYTIHTGKVTSVQLTTNLATPQLLGTTITLSAISEGSIDPDYRFLIVENGVLTTLQDYGNENSVTWTPSKVGKYKVVVQAKDKTAPNSIYEARTEMTYVINTGKVTNVQLTTDLETPQFPGTSITLTAISEGSLDPDYRFFVVENGVMTTLQDYGNGNSVTWTPSKVGKFKIVVQAKDKTAPNSIYEARTEMIYMINTGKVKSVQLTTNLDTPQLLGTPITISASSEGSVTPDYRFILVKNGIMTILQDYSNGNSVIWTPTEVGKYKIIVLAKDQMTPSSIYEARTEMTFVVTTGDAPIN